MTEKRFTLHIKWYTYDKDEGDAELKDKGQPILLSQNIDDMRYLKNLLNELHEENIKLKSENNMLRNTIGRNEAYIERLTHKGEWRL